MKKIIKKIFVKKNAVQYIRRTTVINVRSKNI